MQKVYEIDFDIKESANNAEMQEIEFFAGDVGACRLIVNLMDDGSPVDLSEDTAAKIAFKFNGGGEGRTEDVISDAENGELDYTFKTSDLVPGRNTAWVQVFNGSEVRLTSIHFYYTVKPDPVSPDAVAGSDSYHDVEQILNDFAYLGEYSAGTAYKKYNIVTYEGSSFIALQDTTGHAPPDPDVAVSNDYWGLKSKKGDPSDVLDWKGEYNAGTTYAPADVVWYIGSSYVCIQACTGETPVDGGGYWVLFAEKGDTGTTPAIALYKYRTIGGGL